MVVYKINKYLYVQHVKVYCMYIHTFSVAGGDSFFK